jgi:ABC-type multidrug transport system fused ATPase/permease subunit
MKDVWSLVRDGLRLFTRRGRIVLALYGVSLVLLAALDAAALLLLARVFNLGELPGSSQIVVNTTATSLLLILLLFCLRSILSTVSTYAALRQGATEETRLGKRALTTLMNPRTRLSSDGLGDFHNSVDRGPKELVLIVFHAVTIPCEALTAVAILGALVVYQPLTAIVALVYFAVVAIVQQSVLSRRSTVIGEELVTRTNWVYQLLADGRGLRRVLNDDSASDILGTADQLRSRLTRARAMQTFVATLPRYFLEVVLALGLLVGGGTTYLVSGPPAALAATSLFVAAGFRLLPIVNRIQALTLAIFAFLPTARLALTRFITVPAPSFPAPHDEANVIELEHVSFTYAPTSPVHLSVDRVLDGVSVVLRRGGQYAIVGPSGAGKTTLVDLFLGLNVPQQGVVRVSPTIRTAYVPQDTHIAGIPLRNNVALQWSDHSINRDRVHAVLIHAGLPDFAERVDDDTPLDATTLSGGQKQRIGLARALYADANFLVLDEVTSALDMETERQIYETIDSLRGAATVVIVAHRLSTVQRADEVIYLNKGTVAGKGSFSRLMSELPAFRRQVELSQIDVGS